MTEKVDPSVSPGRGGKREGSGRKKGVPNRITTAAKDAIAQAAEGLGGTDRLIAWAQEDPLNERAFWTSVYPKLIPVTLAGDKENPLNMQIQKIERVIVRPSDKDA